MSSMGSSDVGEPHLGHVRVKNTFLDVVCEESETSTIQRRGSAPPRLADDSAVYQFFGDEGSNFFSEGPNFFSEGAYGLAASSDGLGGLTDSGDEDGPASGEDARASGAAASGSGGGRTRKGRACKSKRDRCQKFLNKMARRLAENPDLDIQQIDLPVFVHGEWLTRHARAGLERIRDDPPVPGAPDGPQVPGPQPAPPVPRVPGLQ